MKRLKDFLNKSVVRKDFFKNYSVATLLLMVIYSVAFIFCTLGPVINGNKLTSDLADRLTSIGAGFDFSATGTEFYLVASIPFIIFVLQFLFLHKKSSCYTTLSFSISRKNLFRNRLILPLVFILAVTFLVKLYVFKLNVDALGFSTFLLQVFIAHLLAYTNIILFGTFCIVFASLLSGRTIEAVVSGLSIFFLPSIVSSFVHTINGTTLYGAATYSVTILNKIANALNPLDLSNSYYISKYNDYGNPYATTSPTLSIVISLCWIVALSIGLLALSKYFEKHYKPEKSGFKGASRIASAFISTTLPLTIVMYLYDGVFAANYYLVPNGSTSSFVIICLFVLVFVVCAIICNLVVHFTYKKISSALIGIGVTLAFTGILAGINASDIFGTYNKIPEKEDIKEINVTLPYEAMFNSFCMNGNVFDFFATHSSDILVADTPAEIDSVIDFHKVILENRAKTSTIEANITYILKDGTEIYREYTFISEEAVEQALKLRETTLHEEYLRELLLPDTIEPEHETDRLFVSGKESNIIICPMLGERQHPETELTDKQFRTLREAVYKDILNISNEEWYHPTAKPLGYISISVYRTPENSFYQGISDIFLTPVYSHMENTLAALKDVDYYKYLTLEAEIDKVYTANLSELMEYASPEHGDLTGPFFSSMLPFSWPLDEAPLTEITDKAEYTELFNKAHVYYYTGGSKDGTMLLVYFKNSETPDKPEFYYVPN